MDLQENIPKRNYDKSDLQEKKLSSLFDNEKLYKAIAKMKGSKLFI